MHGLLVLVLVLVSSPAFAVSWLFGCDAYVTDELSPGQFVCASPTSNTDDTDILKVAKCKRIDIQQFDDKTGSGTVSLVTGIAELCPDALPSAGTSDAGCALMHDTATLVGDDAIYGAAGAWMRIRAAGTNTNAAQMRWIVQCS